MHCKNHPDREVVVPCQKHNTGYCSECLDNGVSCTDPTLYCKFRDRCIIWEMGREERKKDLFDPGAETAQAVG